MENYINDFTSTLYKVSHDEDILDFDFSYRDRKTGTVLEFKDLPSDCLEIDVIFGLFTIETDSMCFQETMDHYPQTSYKEEDGLHIFKLSGPEYEAGFIFA